MKKRSDPAGASEAMEIFFRHLATQDNPGLRVSNSASQSSAHQVVSHLREANGHVDMTQFGRLDAIARQVTYPAIIVSHAGKVVAMNPAGQALFGTYDNPDIDDLVSDVQTGAMASDWIRQQLANDVSDTVANFISGRVTSTGNTIRLAIALPSQTEIPPGFALLFVVQARWSLELQRHVQTAFGLTNSEADVLEAFSSGADLKSIAADRGRSLTTVRKQFYQVLEKCDVKTQVDLTHLMFEISQYLETTSALSNKCANPFRQEMTLPRPGGRTLQVAIAGDRAGPAIVLLAFAGQRCFPASFEKQLFEANLQLLSLSPPGYGATSKPNKDEDFAEVACGDYIALLDQLGIEKAVILADGPTLFQAVDFAQRQPDRVQQILTTIPFLPKRFESGVKKKSSFYDYIMAAFSRSSQLRKFAAVALIKAFFKMDVHMFLWAVYKRDPVAFETVIQSGLALEMEASFLMAVEQGLESSIVYLDHTYEDWSEVLSTSDTFITIYRPQAGGLGNEQSFKALANLYPNNVSYVSLAATSDEHRIVYPLEFIRVMRECFIDPKKQMFDRYRKIEPFAGQLSNDQLVQMTSS